MNPGVDPEDFTEMVREIRRFVREQVVPLETEIDETDEIPPRIREQAKELGLFGFAIPVVCYFLDPMDRRRDYTLGYFCWCRKP